MLVFEEWGKPKYPEKNPRRKDENQHPEFQAHMTQDNLNGMMCVLCNLPIRRIHVRRTISRNRKLENKIAILKTT